MREYPMQIVNTIHFCPQILRKKHAQVIYRPKRFLHSYSGKVENYLASVAIDDTEMLTIF